MVDAEGYTRIGEAPPTADVLVDCDEGRFHRWAMPRLLGQLARGGGLDLASGGSKPTGGPDESHSQ